MTRITTTCLLAVAALVAGFTTTGTANAQENAAPALRFQPNPGPGPLHQIPKFGYLSDLHHDGYFVRGVYPHTAAQRMGLEYGDHIVGATVNGYYRSFNHGGWSHAVTKAMYGSGWMKLHIRDVRTGHTLSRWTNVNDWQGHAVVRLRSSHP